MTLLGILVSSSVGFSVGAAGSGCSAGRSSERSLDSSSDRKFDVVGADDVPTDLSGDGPVGAVDAPAGGEVSPGDAIDDTSDSASGETCFPACIQNVRARCPRPVVGSCIKEVGGQTTSYCYSNGLVETDTVTGMDAGEVDILTYSELDGKTPCLTVRVHVDPSGNVEADYYDPSGAEFAVAVQNDIGQNITCDGQTTVLTFAQLTNCSNYVGEGSCVSGTCP